MSERTLFVDAMNLAYRIAYTPSFMGLTDINGNSTGIIHGFLISLLAYARSTDEIVVAWDSRSERKRSIYPEYKISRDNKDPVKKKLDEDIRKQIEPLKKIIHVMGFTQYRIEGYEADEIIGELAVMNTKRSVIISEDKDYLQLINDKISVWQPIKKRIVTIKNFAELYYNMTPEEYLTFRTFTGDESDEITGVPGCGEKTGIDIALRRTTKLTEKLYKRHASYIIDDYTERNYQLMKLGEGTIKHSKLIEGKKIGTFDIDRLEKLLEKYSLKNVKDYFIEKIS